jgi:hypothetical protein
MDLVGSAPIDSLIHLFITMSLTVHDMYDTAHSRRDDLEALGFILAYFAAGTLPWLGN